jgi:Cys-tRNA(Pro)/Cys-tRNA(Cys) deacylase
VTAKTNAARRLDELGIAYTLHTYSVGREHPGAAEVAAQVGMDPGVVFKTLVAEGDRNGPCFAVVRALAPAGATATCRVALATRAGERHHVDARSPGVAAGIKP